MCPLKHSILTYITGMACVNQVRRALAKVEAEKFLTLLGLRGCAGEDDKDRYALDWPLISTDSTSCGCDGCCSQQILSSAMLRSKVRMTIVGRDAHFDGMQTVWHPNLS